MLELDRRRSVIDILADILRLLRLGEAGKTEIMYTVSMSYRQAQKYIDWLLRLGLMDRLTEENGVVSYQITRRGLMLLRNIEEVQEMLKGDEALDILHAPEPTKPVSKRPHSRTLRFLRR